MDLKDLVDEKGLQQDDWSLTKPVFGKDGQIQVVGWSGRDKWGIKCYILKCRECNQDSELFGEGYFKSMKGGLIKGAIPCGCSKLIMWQQDQYKVLCDRKSKGLGNMFHRFVGEWRGQYTKIVQSCPSHGEWNTGTINNLLNALQGCPRCRAEATGLRASKPDNIMVESFLASGGFHPDTKFWRSERLDSKGWGSYWHFSCPECGDLGEASGDNLQNGHRSCGCSCSAQQLECYINVLSNDSLDIAVKFGIARNSQQRLKCQNRKSIYNIRQHSVYLFPDVVSCKKAERDCKRELVCGVVLKRDMEDGYTETTWVYNLEKIIEIYERNGGIKK